MNVPGLVISTLSKIVFGSTDVNFCDPDPKVFPKLIAVPLKDSNLVFANLIVVVFIPITKYSELFTKDPPPLIPMEVPIPTKLYFTLSPVSNTCPSENVMVSLIRLTSFVGEKFLLINSSTKTGVNFTSELFPPKTFILGIFLIFLPLFVTKIS